MTSAEFIENIQSIDGFLEVIENSKINNISTNIEEWVIRALISNGDGTAKIITKQYYNHEGNIYTRR